MDEAGRLALIVPRSGVEKAGGAAGLRLTSVAALKPVDWPLLQSQLVSIWCCVLPATQHSEGCRDSAHLGVCGCAAVAGRLGVEGSFTALSCNSSEGRSSVG